MADTQLHTHTQDIEITAPQSKDVVIGSPMDKGGVLPITKNGKYVVSDYDLAEVEVTPLPAQTKEVTITENGTKEVTPDEDRLLNKVVIKTDTTESVILNFLNNGGTFAYSTFDELPKFDWSKLDKPNYDYFFYQNKCTWSDVQNLLNIYTDDKSFNECTRSIKITDKKEEVTITMPKGFNNSKKQNCILEIIATSPGLKLLTVDFTDVKYTGTFLGWTHGFRVKLLNTSKLISFYNPTSNLEFEAFDCSSLQSTPYNGVHNSTTYIGGFINLGKGFLQNGTSSQHTMYFNAYMQNLSKESLLNIFDGLHDLNLLGFTFANQPTIKMGASNFAKVTDDDIKIATDKGWTVTQ